MIQHAISRSNNRHAARGIYQHLYGNHVFLDWMATIAKAAGNIGIWRRQHRQMAAVRSALTFPIAIGFSDFLFLTGLHDQFVEQFQIFS